MTQPFILIQVISSLDIIRCILLYNGKYEPNYRREDDLAWKNVSPGDAKSLF